MYLYEKTDIPAVAVDWLGWFWDCKKMCAT